MMLDRELLDEFLQNVAEKYTAAELVELLEDTGILNIQDVIAALEEFIIEGRSYLAV